MHIVIVDPNLVDFIGHHFEYDSSIREAVLKRGDRVSILGNRRLLSDTKDKLLAVPVFTLGIWDGFHRYKNYIPFIQGVLSNFSFLVDLLKGNKRLKIQNESILLFHTLTRHQLLGCALYSLFFQPKNIKSIYFLRYQREFYSGRFGKLVFWIFRLAKKKSDFDFYTDSEILSADLTEVLHFVPKVAPIPHSFQRTLLPTQEGKKVRLVVLGNAREEKGILDVLKAIDLYSLDQDATIEFSLQINNPDLIVQPVLKSFQKVRRENIQLIDQALNSLQYLELLQSADIVLLPYWPSIYKGRTSGPFIEAISAGKPVIVSAETWMSEELKKFGAGVICESKNAYDLVRAIREACARLPELKAKALNDRSKVLSYHNPEKFLQEVLPRRKSRVLILYPWGDLREGKTGASLQVNLQCEFLKDYFDEIHVIQGSTSESFKRWNIFVEGFQYTSFSLKILKKTFTLFSMICFGSKSRTEACLFWYHIQDLFDRQYINRIEDAAKEASVIILHYSFGAFAVAPIAKKLNLPFFIMQYDIISDIIASSKLRKWCLKTELSALKTSPYVGCVTRGDQEFFLSQGVHAEYFPGVVRLPSIVRTEDLDVIRKKLEVKFSIPANKKICLFVGSGYFPNVAAADKFVEIAAETTSSSPFFVLVGQCRKPGEFFRGISLGRVGDQSLMELYQIADLVVIPLVIGTGISIKTIEAMAYGKAILGTSKAFRGIDFKDGVQGVQCDDFTQFPIKIEELLASPEKLETLGRGASLLATAHDFSNVFKKILPFLESKSPSLEAIAVSGTMSAPFESDGLKF